MTVTTETTPAPPDLEHLTDEELAGAYAAADIDNPAVYAAFHTEFDQRTAAERTARARERQERAAQQLQYEWYDAMHAQRMQAEAYCRGWLLNPEARRLNAIAEQTGKTAVSEWQLWTGPAWLVQKYGSEELLAFFGDHPRLTLAEYKRQRSRAGRVQREEWRDRHEISKGDTTDGHDDRNPARPGLDDVAAGALQPGPPAPQAPQSAGGTVPGDGRADGDAEGGEGRGNADGRPGQPVLADGPLARAAAVRQEARRHREAQLAAMRQRAAERRAARTGTTRDGADVGIIGTAIAADRALRRRQEARQEQAAAVPSGAPAAYRPAGTAARGPRIPGDQLLDLIRDGWLGQYARLPSPAALDAVTLWAAHTHMRDENGILVFRATPRLYLLSSEPGSGKSHVLELLMRIVPNCHGLDLEPTKAGLVHTLNKEKATVLLDEGDLLFAAGQRHSDVRAVINGGTYRHGTVLNGKGAKANREPVFGPLALAGLDVLETGTGDTLNALMSRGVKIRMEKASGDDRPAKLTRHGEDAAAKALVWLERWAAQVRDEVAGADPEVPEGIEGRAEDIWAPLLSVADAAGGSWPERARAACLELALGKLDSGEDLESEFAEFAGSFAAQ